MTYKDDQFFKKLISTFKAEAKERIQQISSNVLDLEKSESSDTLSALTESIYRELHSLKSAARAVNVSSIEHICQSLESAFSQWKTSKMKPNVKQIDLIYKAIDIVEKLITKVENEKKTDIDESLMQEINVLQTALDSITKIPETTKPETKSIQSEKDGFQKIPPTNKPIQIIGKEKKPENQPILHNISEKDPAEKTIRISADKLDTLLVKSEEMLSAKLDISQRISDLYELKNMLLSLKKEQDKILADQYVLKKSIKSEKDSNPQLMTSQKNILDFITVSENYFKTMTLDIDNLKNNLEQNLHHISLGVDGILEETKKLMLWPFSTILNNLPRMVRDLAHSLEKEVNFHLEGTELEIDKRILQEVNDILIHLVRNSIDHGIENKVTRLQLKKPEAASLNIHIQHMTGNEIQIVIQDDGAGIDVEAVKKSAVEQKIISAAEAAKLSYDEALMLIFQSGVTASKIISNVSGRGLGMTIIREKIEKVGGKISIHSTENIGTTTKIILPLTLATFRGLSIRTSHQDFIIPISNLERVLNLSMSDIKNVENRETVLYDGQVIPLVWLSDALGLARNISNMGEQGKLLVLILASVEKRIAFVVDEILNEHEILVKHFSRPLLRIRNIAATAMLGSGNLIPILNTLDLLQVHNTNVPQSSGKTQDENSNNKHQEVLLAEDSITTRMFLKNVLELDGFHVTTAVDGFEAWEKLKEMENKFVLLVSDIEMPRMNGFELTEKIRNDKHLKDLPIVLVTGREAQKDKEKGIDLGANAYVLKSSFDSKHLIDVVKRLRR